MATSLSRRCPPASSPVCGRGFRDPARGASSRASSAWRQRLATRQTFGTAASPYRFKRFRIAELERSSRPAKSARAREAGRVNCHPNRRPAVPPHFGAEAGQGAVPVHARDSRSRRERAVLAATPAGALGSLRGCRGTKVPTPSHHWAWRCPATCRDARRPEDSSPGAEGGSAGSRCPRCGGLRDRGNTGATSRPDSVGPTGGNTGPTCGERS
jgi:hypothetical protein